jgi:hypothetical protein
MARRPDRWTDEHRIVKAHRSYTGWMDKYLAARDAYIDAREEQDHAREQRDSIWFSKAELKVVRTWTEMDEATREMRAAFRTLRHEQSEMNSRGHWL